MVLQHLPRLAQSHIVLASGSPRRAELLRGLGLPVEVIPSTFEEDLDKSAFADPGAYAQETAKRKAMEVATRISMAAGPAGRLPHLIIAADTVVELSGRVMEKPRDERDAFAMLRALSGQQHRVYTGTALVVPTATDPLTRTRPLLRCFQEETQVEFGELEEEQIWAYIATREPMDKAGAYGIQGLGAILVRRLQGCYFNVMGLPIHRLATEVDALIRSGDLALPPAAGN